jgi:hypothetical protein
MVSQGNHQVAPVIQGLAQDSEGITAVAGRIVLGYEYLVDEKLWFSWIVLIIGPGPY